MKTLDWALSLSWNLIWVHLGACWKPAALSETCPEGPICRQQHLRASHWHPGTSGDRWEGVGHTAKATHCAIAETICDPGRDKRNLWIPGSGWAPGPNPNAFLDPTRDRWLHVSLWHHEPLAGPSLPKHSTLQISQLTPPLNHVLLPGGARSLLLSPEAILGWGATYGEERGRWQGPHYPSPLPTLRCLQLNARTEAIVLQHLKISNHYGVHLELM